MEIATIVDACATRYPRTGQVKDWSEKRNRCQNAMDIDERETPVIQRRKIGETVRPNRERKEPSDSSIVLRNERTAVQLCGVSNLGGFRGPRNDECEALCRAPKLEEIVEPKLSEESVLPHRGRGLLLQTSERGCRIQSVGPALVTVLGFDFL